MHVRAGPQRLNLSSSRDRSWQAFQGWSKYFGLQAGHNEAFLRDFEQVHFGFVELAASR